MKPKPIFYLILLLSLLFSAPSAAAQEDAPLVILLTADGPVTPAMAEYLSRGIRTAESLGAEALVFQLDTPGGSVDLMDEMVQDMLASPVPVIVYVTPRGGHGSQRRHGHHPGRACRSHGAGNRPSARPARWARRAKTWARPWKPRTKNILKAPGALVGRAPRRRGGQAG